MNIESRAQTFPTALVTDRKQRYYFSGVDIAEGYLLTGKNPAYFSDLRYFSELQKKLKNTPVIPVLYTGSASIENYLKENGISALSVDYSKTTVEEYKAYKKFGVKISDCKDKLSEFRSVKTETELKCIKKACEIIEKALNKTYAFIKEGVSESYVKNKIEEYVAFFGGEGTSFDTIVAFGLNSACPHHETDDTTLKKNMPVLIDTGALYKGYSSDITRTLFFGSPSKKFAEAYNAVLSANVLAEEKIKIGMGCKEADGIARTELDKKDYAKYFTHSLGHGVGLDIHESPYLSPKGKGTLKENQAFTIEPGVYLDGEFGIRIEDTVVLTRNGVAKLYSDDKKLKIING